MGPEQNAAVYERALSAGLAMDAVTLRVGDLEQMSGYYENALALTPIEERARGAEVHRVLGRGDVPMVRLIHTPGLPGVNPREAGLFHTAFLFDDAAGLAATVYRTARDPRSRFAGSSDHLVSEAFYFTDPEGYDERIMALQRDAQALTLEVRASNTGAQELYRRFGFAPAGVRKSYYPDNHEDAIIMWAHDIGAPDMLDRYAVAEQSIAGATLIEGVDLAE